jgi:hypothetical protein
MFLLLLGKCLDALLGPYSVNVCVGLKVVEVIISLQSSSQTDAGGTSLKNIQLLFFCMFVC